MPKAITQGRSASSVERVVADLKDEYQNDAKFKANLRLLRAFAVFAAGVIVARNFGETLFVG
jgi:hypothetical protein